MSTNIVAAGQVTLVTQKDGSPGKQGETGKDGKDGIDANLLDWVKDWDSGKTIISSDTIITPKIFAGTKNTSGTITGTAIGRFTLLSRNSSGQFQSEEINGIYGFSDGLRTFAVDETGSVELGRGDQSIRYDSATGKILFGKEVSLNWQFDIDKAISNSQPTDRNYIKYSTFVQDNIEDIVATHGVVASIDTGTKYQGFNTLKIIQSVGSGTNAQQGRVMFYPTKLCSPASFSMWVKANTSITSLYIRIGTTIAENFPLSTQWRLIKLENLHPAEKEIAFGCGNPGVNFHIALPMLVEGPEALDWAPSMDDLKLDISLAKKLAEELDRQATAESWSTKLTYIGSTGIFTGTLSANTVNAIQINASQITTGTLSADRINVAELKSKLITAENIEALTLNVVRGKIGGWSLDADSIFRGTKNNTAGVFTAASGSITIGSNGIRGFKWMLDSTGAGKLAGGNISWDAAGNVTFGASVILSWQTPISEIKTALGGNNYPKLTHITSTGIYTGTLTAEQVNAVSIDAGSIKTGTLSADRIATGSIKAEKLDVDSVRASIITVDYLSGLTLNFVRGKIGGWTIGSDTINGGGLGVGNTLIQLRTTASGTGYVYTGSFKPMGLTISWHQSSNAGHLVFGSINATGNTLRVGFIGLQMMSWDHQEYFCLSANAAKSGSKEVYNRIAGWAFDHQTIYKGNVSLGADGSISNGAKWRLANDGSGSLASGNISWDASGKVTFSAAVSLNWENASIGNTLYVRGCAFNNQANRIIRVNDKNIVDTTGRGFNLSILKRSDLSLVSSKTYDTYGSINLGDTLAEAMMAASSDHIVILTSWDSYYTTTALNNAIEWCGGIAPALDYRTPYAFIGIPGIRKGNGLTSTFGQSASDPHAEISTTVINGVPVGFNITGNQLTYIDGNGVYTGTLTAAQINAVAIDAASIRTGYLAAERIAAGSIRAEKLDVANVRASIVTADHINGLTLNFTKGKIGGWNIGADYISQGVHTAYAGSTAIQIRSVTSGSGTVYSGGFKPYGFTVSWYQSSNAGHIVLGQVMASVNSVKSGFMGLQMMNHSGHEFFCLSANTSLSGSTAYYNRIAGWNFDHQAISKNSVYLGADGSIYHVSNRWRLNNDGSGSVANGNISWNAAGVVTFAASVSLNWTSPINNITNALGGSSYPKLTQITATGIYTGTISASQVTVNSSLIVGGSTTAASYNGSIIVRNTANTNVVVLDRTGIKATAGKIGNWTIDSDSIFSGTKKDEAGQFTASSGSVTIGSKGIRGYKWQLDATGAGQLAGGNISWTVAGVLSLKDAIVENVWIKGNIRNAFIKYDNSVWVTIGGGSSTQKPLAEKYDNLCTFGGSDANGWTVTNPQLPWTPDQSGRRLTLVHWRYGNDFAYGNQVITAQSGRYFYEDGLAKSKLEMSREVVELLGLGTPTIFHGWIVLNRRDIGTTNKYGSPMKFLAMGTVTFVSNTSARIKYRTYDGGTMSVTKPNIKGTFYVNLPWSLGAENYMVMLSGIWSTQDNGPIYATIKAQGSNYFHVQTQDDDTPNNGSFNFVVISAADFK